MMARSIFFFATLFLCAGARAEKWKIFSIRKPVSIMRADRETVIASRGMALGDAYQISVGAKGGIVFESDSGGTLSLIGPALLHTRQLGPDFVLFRAEYGDVYFKKPPRARAALETTYFRAYGEEQDFELYLDAPIGSSFFRVRNLKAPLDFGNRFLEEGLSLSRVGAVEDVLANRSEDIQLCRARHLNNRYNQELSSPVDKPYDPDAVDTLSGLFEMAPFAGTTKFLASNSAIGQYTGFAGLSFKTGTNLYLNLPKEPSRIDFIESQHARIGLGVGVFSGNFHFAAGYFERPSLFYATVFVGAAYQGLGIDIFAGVPYRLGAGASASYKISALYGADLQIRWDLKKLSGSETGVLLGLRTLVLPLSEITATLRSAAGLTSSRLTTLNFAPFVGLSMRF